MRSLLVLAGVTLLALAVGCGPSNPPKPPVDDHDHGHDHHHGHDHGAGPNGGKMLEAGEHHLEWVVDGKSGKVLFVVLDESMKKEVPIAQAELAVDVALPGKEKVEYKVPAVNAADGKASRFETTSVPLATALQVGAGVTLHIEVEGQKHDLKFEHHDEGHGHDH